MALSKSTHRDIHNIATADLAAALQYSCGTGIEWDGVRKLHGLRSSGNNDSRHVFRMWQRRFHKFHNEIERQFLQNSDSTVKQVFDSIRTNSRIGYSFNDRSIYSFFDRDILFGYRGIRLCRNITDDSVDISYGIFNVWIIICAKPVAAKHDDI